MIKVELLGLTMLEEESGKKEVACGKELEALMSFAAYGCYEGEKPHIGKVINLKNRIFDTGHHTILQHIYATFWLEGLAISDFTFGLHLAHSFYNSSQRSGRFCSSMFSKPDFTALANYIHAYWPTLKDRQFAAILGLVRKGAKIYEDNLIVAMEHAAKYIKQERPLATEKYINQNALKFAQEQLRVFLPTIFPTAATFTINLSTLSSLCQTAWSPTLKDISRKMADLIIQKCPNIAFMFESVNSKESEKFWRWTPDFNYGDNIEVLYKPKIKLIDLEYNPESAFPEESMTHPADLLNFHPCFMKNRKTRFKTKVEISVATMGQDQRHRTTNRTEPRITGNFYLPPLAALCRLEDEALEIMNLYRDIAWDLSQDQDNKTLVTAIIPYGAMVEYEKEFDLNSAIHEMSKRGCWCAQEEIYHLASGLRNLIDQGYMDFQERDLLKIFLPACLKNGKCGEGARYCGRDIGQKPHFPERKI
ncbi:MAG: hypothetical protein US71_C0001G0129 [Parcubacteria group bacterium GW2011_GWD2_38_12]|nr:MAG: hypothetical protein US71_C0001G0129 [Parcubacteria group bacterium GW2011_GWD2_38_12]KKQ59131.1 MAG: hypothetical protein US79_C0001G0130 [Parcubacteria group bacterium GW2011_GWC1_38_17]KKQ59744.1 MAG: hypothetical protein US78_C0001G0104 [Parcubacteria group bacterium GW2011_GWD1_38_16]